MDSRKYSKKSPAGLGEAVDIKKKEEELSTLISINRQRAESVNQSQNHSNSETVEGKQHHQSHNTLMSDPFHTLFWGEKNSLKDYIVRQTVEDSTAQI